MADANKEKQTHSGKNPKKTFYQSEKRMERVRFNNYRDERKLKETIGNMNKDEDYRMGKIKHEILLLQMELKARKCKEVVMELKADTDKNNNHGDTKKNNVAIEQVADYNSVSEPTDELKQKRRVSFAAHTSSVFWSDASDDDDRSVTPLLLPTRVSRQPPLTAPPGRRFSSVEVPVRRSGLDDSDNFLSKQEFLRKRNSSKSNVRQLSAFPSFKNGFMNKTQDQLSDSDSAEQGDKHPSAASAISKPKLNKLSEKLPFTAKLINALKANHTEVKEKRGESDQKFIDPDIHDPDQYTDGAMALAKRQLEYKKRESMPTISGHLPIRKRRSIEVSWQFTDANSSKRKGNLSLRDRNLNQSLGRNSESASCRKVDSKEKNDAQQALPPVQRFTMASSNRVYVPKKQEILSAKEESRQEQAKIQKLKRVTQAEKYNEALGKVKKFLLHVGGKVPAGSQIPLQNLDEDEKKMLTKFKARIRFSSI